MIRRAMLPYGLCVLCVLRSAAFDAAPLVQFCAAGGSAAPANWYDGLGLTALWTLDEGAGTNVADKISAINAAFVGTPQPVWASVGGITAPLFNGSNSYVTAGDVLDLGTNAAMAGCWVYMPAAPSNVHTLVGKAVGYAYEYRLYVNPSRQAVFIVRNAASAITVSLLSSALTVTNWHHVAFVRQPGGGTHLMVNGALSASSTNNIDAVAFNSTQPFAIGSALLANSYFSGYISGVFSQIGGIVSTNNALSEYNASRAIYGK